MASVCHAGIFYDDEAKCIRVIDFPKDAPCTLTRLRQMDRLCNWGKVSYNRDADTYTIVGNLCIGTNDGTNTHFQIGGQGLPHETLVMKGRLVVHPYWIEGENPERTYWKAEKCVNRLTIGVPGDASITATLKFDAEHSLYLGRILTAEGKLRIGHGGQLHVHYGTITSATPGVAFGPAASKLGICLTGDSVILDHATLSWIRGFMTYGMGQNARVSDSVFEHGGAAIINGRHDLRGCVFRDCGIAIKDYGSLDATVTDCTFESNDHNWTLTFTDKGLVCIDCTWDAPKKGNQYRSWKSRRTGQKQYPCFVSKRHIVVEVVDGDGRPVAGARVKVRCDQGATAMAENGTQITNKLGRTPGRGEERPILLTEITKRATDVADQPRVTTCSYTIEASADGFAPRVLEGYRPARSWETVRIVLPRD